MAVIEIKVKTWKSIIKTVCKSILIYPLFIRRTMSSSAWESKILEIDMTEEKYLSIKDTCLSAKVKWKYPQDATWRESKHIGIYNSTLVKLKNKYSLLD